MDIGSIVFLSYVDHMQCVCIGLRDKELQLNCLVGVRKLRGGEAGP